MSDPATTLVFTIDERFAMPLAATLASVVTSAEPGERVRAIVLHDAIPAEVRARLEAPLHGTAVEVEWRDGNQVVLDGIPTTERFSRATYFRLALPATLAGVTGRVIYLDADLLVVRSLAPLVSRDLGGAAFAAVKDSVFPFLGVATGIPNWRELGWSADTPYCNTGVLVIDLEAWSAARLTERIVEYVDAHAAKMHYQDQDSVNGVLGGGWHELEPRWNQQPPMLGRTGVVHLAHTPEELDGAADDPAVIHYATWDKPWHHGCRHPATGQWFGALDRSGWAGWRPGRKEAARAYRERAKRAAKVVLRR